MRGICVFREIDRRESRVFYEENLLSLFKSSQSQSYLIYRQSKVQIYTHCFAYAVVVITHKLQQMTKFNGEYDKSEYKSVWL